MEETIFHQIIKGTTPCYKVWEDEKHLAFLSIFPNTEGVTVVIPKKYQDSYFANVDDEALSDLVIASKKVAKLLDSKLNDVGRTALVFECFGVNYLHAKLYPMHGTANMETWRPIESDDYKDVIFKNYPGFISSHDAILEKSEFLASLAAYLRGEEEVKPEK